jgi:predicted dehydrogenase
VAAAIDVDEPRAEAIAERTGARAFASLEAGLASGTFDAVLVMLPHHLHEDAAVAALTARCHVLLEKPIAPTVAACEHILEVARDADGVLMVAENAQFWPEVVLAKQLLDGGAIGDVITARAWHCLPPIGDFLTGEDPWRLSRERTGGGVAVDAGSHWLRPLRMWLGELVEVVAVTGRPYPAMEAESMCRALCRFDTGIVASFDVVLSPGPGVAPTPLFQITGTTGEIVIEAGGRVKLYDGSEPRGIVVGTGNYLQSYEHQLAAFEAAVLDGQPAPVSPEYALGELRGALAMYRSADSRRWEAVW